MRERERGMKEAYSDGEGVKLHVFAECPPPITPPKHIPLVAPISSANVSLTRAPTLPGPEKLRR